MRIIHTADWHLGRLFYGAHLTDDQAHTLDGLVALAAEVRPDAIIIAGDVYDRAVPPPEAVALLDETLWRLVETGAAVVVIAGNHDNAERLGFGARLLARSNLHVVGPISVEPVSIAVGSGPGAGRIWTMPYADPAIVRAVLGDDTLRGHDEATAALTDRIRASMSPDECNVLVGHAFVTGGVVTEDSERPLTVGGSGEVGLHRFDGFDYAALGHLHRPQQVGSARVRYAGSLLKYSIAEAGHCKSVSVVDVDGPGLEPRIQEVSLPVRRDVRVLRGELRALVEQAPPDNRQDYVYCELEDQTPQFDALGELRRVYPNAIGFRRLTAEVVAGPTGLCASEVAKQDAASLFAGFFEHVTGGQPTSEQRDIFARIADARHTAAREA